MVAERDAEGNIVRYVEPEGSPNKEVRVRELEDIGNNMGNFISLFNSEMTDAAIGPIQGSDKYAGAQQFIPLEGQEDIVAHRRNLEQAITTDYLAFGGQVLKGQQSEREWAEVMKTRPKTTDHPKTWKRFFDGSLDILRRQAERENDEGLTTLVNQLQEQIDTGLLTGQRDEPKTQTGRPRSRSNAGGTRTYNPETGEFE